MSDHKLLTLDDVAKRAAAGHSAFSPSSSKMWLTCSGSLIPNILAHDETSEEAAEGTVAHYVGERWLETGKRPKHLIGVVREVEGFEIEITEEMVSFVGDYVEWCEELEADISLVEERVEFSDLTPIPDQGGTADHIALVPLRKSGFELVITDLKYGKGVPVFAEGNTQGLLYGYGSWRRFKDHYDIRRVRIRIAQPRLEGGMTEWTIPVEKLLEFAELVRERAKDAWQFDAPRTPSEGGCQWCKIRGTCPALYQHLSEVTSGVFDDEDDNLESYDDEEQRATALALEDDLGPAAFRPFDPAKLSTAALAKVLRYRKLMEKFFNSVEDELLDRAISREQIIPGWKLVEGRANRAWPDNEIHVYKRLKGMGLKDSSIYKQVIISPAEAEKKLHAKAGLSTAEAARLVNSVAIKPRGKRSLARVSDKRAALGSDGDVFDDEDAV